MKNGFAICICQESAEPVYSSVNIQMCGWIVAPSDRPEMNTKRAGRRVRSLPPLLLPLMVVFLIPRRREDRLWEQCFLLLLFRLAKDQLSAIHHHQSPLLARTSQLLIGMPGKG